MTQKIEADPKHIDLPLNNLLLDFERIGLVLSQSEKLEFKDLLDELVSSCFPGYLGSINLPEDAVVVGRGIFRRVYLKALDLFITIYDKGIGNYETAMREDQTLAHRGFGLEEGKVVFDRGRKLGAMTLSECFEEYFNGLLIFRAHALESRIYNFKGIVTLIRNGTILPFAINYSQSLTNAINEWIDSQDNDNQSSDLIHEKYGSVAQIAPCSIRVTQTISPKDSDAKTLVMLKDSNFVSDIARNIRVQLAHGIVYLPSNYHLQNIYARNNSEILTADSQDRILLEEVPENLELADLDGNKYSFDKYTLQRLIIATSLINFGLFPERFIKGVWEEVDLQKARITFLRELGLTNEQVNKYQSCISDENDLDKDVKVKAWELAGILISKFYSENWIQSHLLKEKLLQTYKSVGVLRLDISEELRYTLRMFLDDDFGFGDLIQDFKI